MSNRSVIIYSLATILALGTALLCSSAYATKLDAPPLPSKKDLANKGIDTEDGVKIDIPTSGTRWHRKADFRQEEADKKEQEAQAAKKAEEAGKQAFVNAQKARQEQIDNYNKQLQKSVDANNEAVALGKQGRWQEAIQAHETAVQYDPRNKQFRVNLSAARTAYGQQLLAKGDVAAATALFRKALVAAQDNALASRCLSAALKKSGLDPNNAETRIKLGDQLVDVSDIEGAYVEYNAAMQIEPSAHSYIKMGDIIYRFGQTAQAANWYRQAIVKDPDCGAAHRQIGFLEMANKDYTGAAASLRKALILDPKDTAAGTALVELWRRQVAAAPNVAENHLGLAGALQLTGDLVGAESEYRKVQAIEPNNPELEMAAHSLAQAYQHQKAEKREQAAQTFFSQGLNKEALAEINQAVMLEPRNAHYQFMLGQCLETLGDYKGAHQAYLTCVLIDPQNNQEAAARIKRMQSNSDTGISAAQTAQLANRLGAQMAGQSAPATVQPLAPYVPPQAVSQPLNSVEAGAVTGKNMFEQGAGAPTLPNSQLQFRTHDESAEPAAQAEQASGISAGNPFANAAKVPPKTVSNLSEFVAQVADAESHGDYKAAINIMQQLLPTNMQNANLHHRLATDLVSAGDLAEAIPEFRLASALAPERKEYLDDLDRAMTMHKQRLTADSLDGSSTEDVKSISGLDDMGASK